MWNYVIPLFSAALALLQLVKDWGGHRVTWRRAAVLLLIVALGIGGFFNAAKSDAKAKEQASTIKSLTTAVETANQNQAKNTQIFTESFERFSNKLNTLEAQVKTADLRAEAGTLRAELTKTQKALTTPQAVLTPGIFDEAKPDEPRLVAFVTAQQGQPVTVNVSLWNDSQISARNGSLFVRICDACKFHSEPPGAVHSRGQLEQERQMQFSMVSSIGRLEFFPIQVDVPDTISQFKFALRYVCENCIEDRSWHRVTIYTTRLGMKTAEPQIVKKATP